MPFINPLTGKAGESNGGGNSGSNIYNKLLEVLKNLNDHVSGGGGSKEDKGNAGGNPYTNGGSGTNGKAGSGSGTNRGGKGSGAVPQQANVTPKGRETATTQDVSLQDNRN